MIRNTIIVVVRCACTVRQQQKRPLHGQGKSLVSYEINHFIHVQFLSWGLAYMHRFHSFGTTHTPCPPPPPPPKKKKKKKKKSRISRLKPAAPRPKTYPTPSPDRNPIPVAKWAISFTKPNSTAGWNHRLSSIACMVKSHWIWRYKSNQSPKVTSIDVTDVCRVRAIDRQVHLNESRQSVIGFQENM